MPMRPTDRLISAPRGTAAAAVAYGQRNGAKRLGAFQRSGRPPRLSVAGIAISKSDVPPVCSTASYACIEAQSPPIAKKVGRPCVSDHMQLGMFGLHHHLQVGPIVIRAISIPVVNDLCVKQEPAEVFLCNKTMLGNISIRIRGRVVRSLQIDIPTAYGPMRGPRSHGPLLGLAVAGKRTKSRRVAGCQVFRAADRTRLRDILPGHFAGLLTGWWGAVPLAVSAAQGFFVGGILP